MTTGEPTANAVRHTVAYRVAVWGGRLFWVGMLTWFIVLILQVPVPVILAVWVTWVAIGISTHVLLRLAGVRFSLRASFWWIADSEISRQFKRDQLWRPLQ